MKFTESLSQGLVPEWRYQYVEYKAGKKLIKRVAQLQDALLDEDINEHQYDQNAAKANDRTPLLHPVETNNKPAEDNEEGHTTQDTFESDNNKSAKPAPVPLQPEQYSPQNIPNTPTQLNKKSNMSFKTSFFNYSLKSSQQKLKTIESEKNEFKYWLNSELAKVELFFKDKEQEVYERFLVLEDQLYQLKEHKNFVIRDRKNHIKSIRSEQAKDVQVYKKVNEIAYHTKSALFSLNRFDLPSLPSTVFLRKLSGNNKRNADVPMTEPLPNEFDPNYFENRIRNGMSTDRADTSSIDSESLDNGGFSQISSRNNSTANVETTYSFQLQQQTNEMLRKRRKRDYVSHKRSFGVPFLFARKQLKEAMLEHYRSLMLLRSYRVLNRTAFRKITKKFDKLTHSDISGDFMKHLDKSSYFLTSDILDKLIFQVEELFISFFDPESTDRKHSLEKLKSIAYALNNNEMRISTFYPEFFFSGLFIGISIPLLVLAIYTGLYRILNHEFPEGVYLLQIYGGFFLLNMMFLLFATDLIIFDKFKINYKFIFELNIANALDYKQFWVIPSFSFALLSLLVWFSMNDFWHEQFPGRDWPWIYFGVMLGIFFWPFDQFYLSSRRWLQIALWRILLSGFYPVEFRDFFLGDLLCSLTYTMGNISFFFCLYGNHWNGLLTGSSRNNVCGSSRSRAMGFFSSLPSIFRFLQCIRRYTDTGDWFPHLANMVKYGITTIYYCLLSVYRIDRSDTNRAVFITFASINSIYTSTWDIVMDWSLLQVGSKNWLLRDNLFYKMPIYYYVAMVVDVLLRFQWIFYAFFNDQIQQLAATSFLIALAEIFRRIIWVLFRMENEHCTNVTLFRASKDTPLPYPISVKVESAIKKLVRLKYQDFDNLSDLSNFELPPPGRVDTLDSEANVGFNNQIRAPPSPYFATRLHHTPNNAVNSNENMATSTGNDQVNIPNKPSTTPVEAKPHITRRKSTLAAFSETLNRAHIKDFQRKKSAPIDEESEDDDDEDIEAKSQSEADDPDYSQGQSTSVNTQR